ncbi:hypothetical protein L226DRAFT_455248 [Lentinus tigrinus ALCF2SS1-7]|uniref:Uncharacterized protein n=1 Tax=Lentinus tigrinus ALCF2SS1-6 TaxID=1328759 RepID=A0A5C2SU86_9APHY|nr:hypothetical protein L227DRAFT_560001 [Lentinus tigrinus ALCF2SS1-6]RPD80569.1 hypothetical protein L226DRAFT_455248 [Lentinus tigrinus ALCF2SS1-7]
MFEEVCLLCSRPLAADGRAYCSDECESLDVTSPSISTTSSAHPSPFLQSTNNAPNLAEVPALLPSALGHSLDARKTHRVRHSESSSSNSSVSWSALEDDYDEDGPSIVNGANGDDEYYSVHPDYLATDATSKPSLSRNGPSSLAYTRRPSTTNNRSTIPTLHHRNSSASTPSTGSTGVSRSIPYDCPSEDDFSDVQPSSSSICSGRRGRKSEGAPSINEDNEHGEDTVTGKKRRNRASLPAYFSLLVSTSTTPRSHKGPSALSMLSRSLQNSTSPPTPRIAHPVVDTTTAFALPQSARVTKAQSPNAVAAPRGRSSRRDPDGRSLSSRRSPSRSPRPRAHPHQSAHTRARLDSMEKVADWVAHSPVVAAGVRAARQLAQRRNSSPPPLPKFERLHLRDSGVEFDAAHLSCAFAEDEEEDAREETRRGRRRKNELDPTPFGVGGNAPGYGNGRSGLLDRDRERGRTAAFKR